ncbi:hypothetical protein DPMN_037997 [Dreissena polymorpha]|uniref:Uncharacterized protein n=1 Tax=Dreissena polymorpha TaxID=45954 RepID=A0A9D4MEL3_DREPO|nr:hypothetical protein DPMN_037997 [Dreissena polymorpha]
MISLQTVWESPEGASPVWKTFWQRRTLSRGLLQVPRCRRRLSRSLLQVPRRSWRLPWYRHRLSGSLLQVPRLSERLSGTVADCVEV